MQSCCSGRQEGRPATVVACYPSGERCPSCDECARYWLGLRPDATWIEPLESYRDPLEEAREALAARTAPPPAPQSVTPPPATRARSGQQAASTGYEDYDLPQPATTGTAVNPPKAVRTGWKSNVARWFTLQADVQVTPPPAPAQVKTWKGWNPHIVIGFFSWLGLTLLGIIAITISLNQVSGPYGQHNSGLIALGVILIVSPILYGIVMLIAGTVSFSRETHAAWLAQHTPEQIAQIRKAERAALWAGTTVAAVALHEHNKRNKQASAAAFQASHASYVAQQQHRELIDAIQAQQPRAIDPQTAATQRLLAQSAANRNNRGWS